MPYYMRGDYYSQGDPQFGAIVRVAGSVGKALVGKAITRLPAIGTAIGVVGAVRGFFPSRKGPTPIEPPGAGGLPLPGGFRLHPTQILPGGRPGITRAATGAPAGYHLNKAKSYRYNMEAGTYYVKNRRMDPANARALRRAVRREHRFVALAKRALRGTGITIGRRGFGKKKATRR